ALHEGLDADDTTPDTYLPALPRRLRHSAGLEDSRDRGRSLSRVHPARYSAHEPRHQLADELIVVRLRRQARALHRRGPHKPHERSADSAGVLFRRNPARGRDGRMHPARRRPVRRDLRPAPVAAGGDRGPRRLRLLRHRHDGRRFGDEDRAHLVSDEHRHPAAHVLGRGLLLRRDAAGFPEGGDVLQPDLLHRGRRPLRHVGHLRPQPLPDARDGVPDLRPRLLRRLVGHQPWSEPPLL
ncbi:MAG: Efflux ABC transporter, permease protein, partial [uncultured Rubrobacteraceae bacterium]